MQLKRMFVASWAVAACWWACPAGAQTGGESAVAVVNRIYGDIAPAKRSDLIVLPALAKMAAPPGVVATPEQAALLPASSGSFAAAAAWATAPEQAAALKALREVTQAGTWRETFAFGQPYGAEGVPPELIRARLYTELGDPPLLAAANHLYLPALDRLACLAHVEATRQAAEGKAGNACNVLIDLAFFARQMCDRQMFDESAWGFRTLCDALARVRDVAYVDSRGASPSLDAERTIAIVKRLSEDGPIDLARITFPKGDRAACTQTIERVYGSGQEVSETVFASTMARLGASERPLRLFSEEARWRAAGAQQLHKMAAERQSGALFDDWAARWNLDPFDKRLGLPTHYASRSSILQGGALAAVSQSTPDLGVLADLRQMARVEAAGTRTAVALIGAYYVRKSFPPQVSAIRPRWMAELDADPCNPNRANGAKPPLEYFVPLRDNAPTTGQSDFYAINVVAYEGGPAIGVRLLGDTFVLYSWGSNYAKDHARRVQNTMAKAEAADYLLWPPVRSLYRQHLMDVGSLK